jgi:hypothetical protein
MLDLEVCSLSSLRALLCELRVWIYLYTSVVHLLSFNNLWMGSSKLKRPSNISPCLQKAG